jgi:hypothetical protein
MGSAVPNLARFLHRLHRRLFVVRWVEHVGVGVVIGAAVSVLLLPVLVMRGRPALPVLAALLLIGAVAGGAWLLFRHPRLIDTAGEADRQLGLADLLATGWLVAREGGSLDDPFERAVLAVADARAASLSPSSVVLNRLGARAWSGIGLTTALAITLAMLSANPINLRADAQRRVAQRALTPSAKELRPSSGSAVAGSRSIPIVPDFPDLEQNGFNLARRTMSAGGDVADSNDHAEAADPSGSGSGSGTSRSDPGVRPPNAVSTGAHDQRNGFVAGRGGGGGRSSDAGEAGRGTSTISTGETVGGRAVAAWSMTTWSTRRAKATHAVRAGAVPQRYHDVIRSYFDREAGEP